MKELLPLRLKKGWKGESMRVWMSRTDMKTLGALTSLSPSADLQREEARPLITLPLSVLLPTDLPSPSGGHGAGAQ